MATSLEHFDTVWASLSTTEQSNIKKMSDVRLREKLGGAGVGSAELGTLDRTAMLEKWTWLYVTESRRTEGAAAETLPHTPPTSVERVTRDREEIIRDRELEREKMQLERDKMQAEERKLQAEREDRLRSEEKQESLEREKMQMEERKLQADERKMQAERE